MRGGDVIKTVSSIISRISPAQFVQTKIEIIYANREIREPDTKNPNWDNSGTGLIEKLNRLQNPVLIDPQQYNQDKDKFAKINGFLQDVTGINDVKIEIPNDKRTILVHHQNKILPLENLGTGIHELIIMVSSATILNNALVCIDEPEVHLHPTLQKKFIKYLDENTDNQYIITTHSSTFLDYSNANIFHAELINGSTRIRHIKTDHEKYSTCAEIGYKASDLMQANSIIWVEGPSDRILVNYWINRKNPNLIEGIHYSIMFYGGRLLCHTTPKDIIECERVDNFISLRRLNRNVIIIIDSDKDNAGKRINKTKQRIFDEIETEGGIVWITQGREIENYIDYETFRLSVKKVHPSYSLERTTNIFSDYYKMIVKNDLSIENPDKVKIALTVVENKPDWGKTDLEEQIIKVVNYITGANSMNIQN